MSTVGQLKEKIEKVLDKPGSAVQTQLLAQDRPNTFCHIEFLHPNTDKMVTGYGWAKCNWPDWWNRERGETIAKGKACKKLALAMLEADYTSADIPREDPDA